ncbi:MAG: hypothetical protein GY836_10985, partial [Herbaspirillum sp.]|uniref:helix-turn-helix transcriptional regulator n=1 Tax=Herbaspirillum sp. TaxID=1890675 RepID=UPI00258EE212
MLEINQDLINDLELGPIPEELDRTRNTMGINAKGLKPGEILSDGSWIDSYGIKHYKDGGTYKYSKHDKRVTANGAYSGKHEAVHFSDNEIEEVPVLGLKPRDYQTVLLYMKGLSRRVIAEMLQINEHTVSARLAKPEVKNWIADQKNNWSEDIHSLTETAIGCLR